VDGSRPLTVHRAQTVGARIAAADDHHALTLRGDELLVGHEIALAAPVLQREVVHREVNARQLAAGNGKVSRPAGPASQHHGVELALHGANR
jgi:hypothetical protein